MKQIIWVARANDGKNTLVYAALDFKTADKRGQEWAKRTGKTFYLREYLEFSHYEELEERVVAAQQQLDLLYKKINEARK